MADFIYKYWGTAVVIAILGIIIVLVIRSMIANRKKNCFSCSGKCTCGISDCCEGVRQSGSAADSGSVSGCSNCKSCTGCKFHV